MPVAHDSVPAAAHRTRPVHVDRLVVHQLDVGHAVPGGVDGVVRGILRFAPAHEVVAVVGVLAREAPGRAVGRWEVHDVAGRTVWFLPVARLDSSDQRRSVPHSIRLVLGALRHRHHLPRARVVHAHRVDTAWAARRLFPRTPLVHFVHNQENGLTSGATDSFWGRAPRVHAALERSVVRGARATVVFNEDYARTLGARAPRVAFSPNWYEPDVVRFRPEAAAPHRVVWLGRLEPMKDPVLALDAFAALVALDPVSPWTLLVIGSGTLADDVAAHHATLPPDVAARVRLTGAVAPDEVGELLGGSGVFVMTSVPGYEGHPRVLVEALAAGLPAVVTDGSDTGRLVEAGTNGFVTGRDPLEIASALRAAAALSRAHARASVDGLAAERVVSRILELEQVPRG